MIRSMLFILLAIQLVTSDLKIFKFRGKFLVNSINKVSKAINAEGATDATARTALNANNKAKIIDNIKLVGNEGEKGIADGSLTKKKAAYRIWSTSLKNGRTSMLQFDTNSGTLADAKKFIAIMLKAAQKLELIDS